MFTMMLTTLYPFLGRFLKLSFTRVESKDFFIELMQKAMRYRRESNDSRMDYLDHLINLKNKKQISG